MEKSAIGERVSATEIISLQSMLYGALSQKTAWSRNDLRECIIKCIENWLAQHD